MQQVQQKLAAAQDDLKLLLNRRLKSDAATKAVKQLQAAIAAAVEELGKLSPAVPSAPSSFWGKLQQCLRRSARVCCRCVAGASALSRALPFHEAQLSHAVKAVQDAGVSLQEPHKACQHSLDPLQLSCPPVRPAAYEQLKQALLGGLNATKQHEQEQQQQQGPRVVQLLGLPGMGKSVLVHMLAEELEREGGPHTQKRPHQTSPEGVFSYQLHGVSLYAWQVQRNLFKHVLQTPRAVTLRNSFTQQRQQAQCKRFKQLCLVMVLVI